MRTLSPGESWMCVLDRQWVRPQQRAWGTAELCCSWLCPWALLCCACCCHSSLQGSGKLLGSWNRDLELILQLVQDLSGFVSPSCCSAIRFLGVLEDSSMDPQPSLVTSLGHFLGAAQTEQCCPGLVKVFSADQRRLHKGAVQDPLWCLCCSARWFHPTEPWNARLEETACSFLELDAPWHVWREGSVTPTCLSCSSKGAAKLWIHNSVSCSVLLLCENTEGSLCCKQIDFQGALRTSQDQAESSVTKQIKSASPLEPFLSREASEMVDWPPAWRREVCVKWFKGR